MPGWSLAEPHFADGFRYYGRRGSEDELDHPDLLRKEHLESKVNRLGKGAVPKLWGHLDCRCSIFFLFAIILLFSWSHFLLLVHVGSNIANSHQDDRPHYHSQLYLPRAHRERADWSLVRSLKLFLPLDYGPPLRAQRAAAQRGGSDTAAAVAAAKTC